jgi:hypothetical protein
MLFLSAIFSIIIFLGIHAKATPVGRLHNHKHIANLHHAPNAVLQVTVTSEVVSTSYHTKRHTTTVIDDGPSATPQEGGSDESAGQTSIPPDITTPPAGNTSPPDPTPTGADGTPVTDVPATATSPTSSSNTFTGPAAVGWPHNGTATVYDTSGYFVDSNNDANLQNRRLWTSSPKFRPDSCHTARFVESVSRRQSQQQSYVQQTDHSKYRYHCPDCIKH